MNQAYTEACDFEFLSLEKNAFHLFVFGRYKTLPRFKDFEQMYNMGGEL